MVLVHVLPVVRLAGGHEHRDLPHFARALARSSPFGFGQSALYATPARWGRCRGDLLGVGQLRNPAWARRSSCSRCAGGPPTASASIECGPCRGADRRPLVLEAVARRHFVDRDAIGERREHLWIDSHERGGRQPLEAGPVGAPEGELEAGCALGEDLTRRPTTGRCDRRPPLAWAMTQPPPASAKRDSIRRH